MCTQWSTSARPGVLCLLVVLLVPFTAARAAADEIWVAPTSQQDVGGLQIASNALWPVTPIGAVRFAFAIPDNLQAFQSAKIVLIPHAPGGAATLNVFICPAENGGAVIGACAGPLAQPFTGVTNQLLEVDISAMVAPRVGTPGATYLAVFAFTSPTTLTDHVAGLRFAYTPVPPGNVATLAANTFTGTQTAPAFVGDGANVTAVNATLLDGLDSTAFALTVHGHDVSQVTNAARLAGGNTFTATQTIDGGNLDLDASTAGGGNITKNGTRFLHNFGGAFNTFLGEDSGNFSMSGVNNTGVGRAVLFSNTTGSSNTAMGLSALFSNTTGPQNAAFGWSALSSNLGGGSNAAFGFRALTANVNGGANVAVGADALRVNSIGSNNVAVGFMAGANATGVNNIYLGANVFGVGGEANTIYIGSQGTQSKTTIAGIRGTAVAGAEMVVIDVNGRLGSTPIPPPAANTVGSAQVIDNSLTSDDLAPNSVADSEVAFNYAGSTSKGGAASNLACLGCVDASEVSFAFAGLLANTFAGTQTIDAGNLDLEPSDSANGNILKNGVRFLHNVGTDSTFLGVNAGTLTNTGTSNIGVGVGTLAAIDTGMRNVAIGNGALAASTVSQDNIAIGDNALGLLLNHLNNTAVGSGALAVLTGSTAGSNTAVGKGALGNMTSGGGNTVVGSLAGDLLTIGTNNIYIDNAGAAAESLTIRIGDTQNRAFFAGIRGRTTAVADAIPVLIDSNGQLGTVSSSRRFKEDVRDMDSASDRLFKLHPVTFRYIEAYANGSKPMQFGLIAEEVAEVFPELAVRNANGEVETVHYETLNVLLLNEVQKQQRELDAQRERIAALESRLANLLDRFEPALR
jgi:Chaperone of endosialidase